MLSSFLHQLLWVFLVTSPEKTPTTESESLSTVDITECPLKEHLSQCEAHCQKSCSNYNQPIICPDKCVKGCVCDEGLVRDARGWCVQPSLCPGKDKCPRGEHYDQCKLYCQKNCSNWERPFICPAVCAPGCICDEGTVRGANGQCITTDECPKKEDVFRGSAETTSDSDNYQIYWSCEKGQIRGPDGRCKHPESEIHSIEGGFTCPVNEHFTRCDFYCQKTCKNHDKEIVCPKICVRGCICNDGLVRGPGGNCIETDKCPEKETRTTSVDDKVHVMDNHGCPVNSKCNKHCIDAYHHGYGVCVGRRRLVCECR